MSDLDIEPEAPEVLDIEPDQGTALALAKILPDDFNLQQLLRFLPDVRLKAKSDAAAAAALAIDIKAEGGITKADEALAPIRDCLAEIDRCFKDPCEQGFQLHRRLTGLRADFKKAGEEALDKVSKAIRVEQKRLDQLAEEARQREQAEADRKERERLAAAAKEAQASGASQQEVKQLEVQAQTAVAPLVPARGGAPKLSNSTTAANWKARLKSTREDADELHPAVKDMTEAEREDMLTLVRAVGQGLAPLTMLEINWSTADTRAKSDRATFDVPGLAASDIGSLRKKGRR